MYVHTYLVNLVPVGGKDFLTLGKLTHLRPDLPSRMPGCQDLSTFNYLYIHTHTHTYMSASEIWAI